MEKVADGLNVLRVDHLIDLFELED